MASFHTKTFSTHNLYYTPKSAWEAIVQYLPEKPIIWEAFSISSSRSADYLRELGYTVLSPPADFFLTDFSRVADIIVSNPPYDLVKTIMPRLLEIDMPFCLLMPSSKINTNYFREWSDKNIQIIIPRKRIQFDKDNDGTVTCGNKCNFDCFYYCYKMNLPKDIIWLN